MKVNHHLQVFKSLVSISRLQRKYANTTLSNTQKKLLITQSIFTNLLYLFYPKYSWKFLQKILECECQQNINNQLSTNSPNSRNECICFQNVTPAIAVFRKFRYCHKIVKYKSIWLQRENVDLHLFKAPKNGSHKLSSQRCLWVTEQDLWTH